MPPDTDVEASNGLFTATKFPKVVELISFDEDNDLVVFRKFKRLNVSALLYKQNQLINLEKQVEKETKNDESGDALREVLSSAWPVLQDYNKALLQQAQIFRLENPTNHLIDFLIGQSHGIRHELKSYITEETRDDLVSLASKPKGTIHKGIDKTDFLRHPFLKRRVPGQPRGLEVYYERHVRRVENVVINLVFCTLVLVPVAVFSYVGNVRTKVLIVVSATLAASFLIGGILTDYHRSNLTLMVGYTAILVVFLGNTI